MKLKSLIENHRWSAVVLSEESRAKLLNFFVKDIPVNWEVIAHHQTINPFGIVDYNLVNKTVELTCTHIGKSDKAIAVKVSGYPGKTNNKFPHITLAIDRKNGGKPKHSNDITDWKELETKPKVSGVIKNI